MVVADQRAQEAIVDFLVQRRWTDSEYLDLSEGTNAIVELSDGRLEIRPMPSPEHQTVVLNLATLLRSSRLGKVFVAPMPIRLWEGKFREPDLSFYRIEHLDRIAARHGGPPDLVIEVLSPNTRAVDQGEKLEEYARAGIDEYWIVELTPRNISRYELEGGTYRLVGHHRPGENFRSPVVDDIEIAVEEAFD